MSYNPFVPKIRADLVIIDGRVSEEIIKRFEELNVKVIPTIQCKEVYDAVAYHPDIVMHPLDDKTIIVAPNVYDYYKDILSFTPIQLIKGDKKLDRNYPENIAYNVARVSNYAIHNLKYTDKKLLYYLKKKGIELINVKQGYSKCSLTNVGQNAAITADKSIYKKLKSKGIDTLLIKEGFISLPGLNYGFIGGSTGHLSPTELAFSGQYTEHPNFNEINGFLNKYKIKSIILSNKLIIDIGSIIAFKYN